MERVQESRSDKAMDLIDNAVARANDLSPIPSTRGDLVTRLGPSWPKQKDAAVSAFLKKHFEQIFKSARSSAVVAQKAHIEQSVQYPQFDELDGKLTELAPDPEKARTPLHPKAFRALQPWIQSLTYTDGTPFEENLPTIKQLGENVLSKIRAQYDGQIAVITQLMKTDAVPADCITRVTIEDALIGALATSIHSPPPDSRVPSYEPFTVAKHSPQAASPFC